MEATREYVFAASGPNLPADVPSADKTLAQPLVMGVGAPKRCLFCFVLPFLRKLCCKKPAGKLGPST